jgi:hypothetical protein
MNCLKRENLEQAKQRCTTVDFPQRFGMGAIPEYYCMTSGPS